MIQHTGKGDKDHAQQRVLGSTGIVASCRSVWGLYPAKTPEGHRYFAPIKTNNCIEPTAVEFVIDRESGGQVQTVNASLEKTGDDIEAEYRTTKQHERQRQGSSSARSVDCCAWLESLLLSGEKPYREILEEGTSLDFSESMIKRSRNTIGAISRKQGFGGAAVWSLDPLPVQSGQTPENDEKPDSLTLLDEPLRDKDLRQQNPQSGQAIPIYTERDLNGDCTPPTDGPAWSADGPESLLNLPETEAMKEPKRIKI